MNRTGFFNPTYNVKWVSLVHETNVSYCLWLHKGDVKTLWNIFIDAETSLNLLTSIVYNVLEITIKKVT